MASHHEMFSDDTFTGVSITGELVAAIAETCVTSINVMAVVVATSIVAEAFIDV